jgi:Spy/CpxP family protein refolding chaperone
MKQKLNTYILVFLIGISFVTAQKKNGFSKIKTLKVNYISEALNLSPETAQAFWPIYNAYQESTKLYRFTEVNKIKEKVKSFGRLDEISDKEAKSLSKNFLEIEKQRLQNKLDYFEKIQKVLTPQQLLQLHLSEIEFNKKVLRRLQKKK